MMQIALTAVGSLQPDAYSGIHTAATTSNARVAKEGSADRAAGCRYS